MLKYVIKRILQAIPVIIIVSFVIFMLVRFIPGDPVLLLLGEDASPEVYVATREKLGLDKPALEQYVTWVGNVLQGDLGTSFNWKKPVGSLIAGRLPDTLILAAGAVTLSVIVGVIFGTISALKHNKAPDYIVTTISMLAISTPGYFLAIIMMLIFSITLKWFPTFGLDTPMHYVLPILTLGIQQIGMMSRMTRSAMLDVLNQDYIRTAKASGVPRKIMIFKNALRNTMIPLTTIIGLRFGGLLVGAVLMEKVFSIHGMGSLMIDAVSFRDYPVVQACILLYSMIFIVVTLLADICYGLFDPRISVK